MTFQVRCREVNGGLTSTVVPSWRSYKHSGNLGLRGLLSPIRSLKYGWGGGGKHSLRVETPPHPALHQDARLQARGPETPPHSHAPRLRPQCSSRAEDGAEELEARRSSGPHAYPGSQVLKAELEELPQPQVQVQRHCTGPATVSPKEKPWHQLFPPAILPPPHEC